MDQSKRPAPETLIQQLITRLWQEPGSGTDNPEDWLPALQSRIGESLQNLLAAGFSSAPGTNIFTTMYHPAVLQVQLTPYQMTVGTYVRFRTDDQLLGDVSANHKGRALCITPVLPSGSYRIRCELLNRSRKNIASVALPTLRLEVLDNRPIVLVDDLTVQEHPARMQWMNQLASEYKFRWVAVDFEHKAASSAPNRTKDTNPSWPRLVVQDYASKFAQYDVDFRHTFLDLVIRRLRAEGAPVLAFVRHPDYENGTLLGRTVAVLELAKLPSNPLLPKLAGKARTFQLQYRASEPLDWRIQQMTGTKATAGNCCAVEFDNRKARLAVCKLIDNAQKNIDLQTYIFKDGRFVSELSVALVRAARRGVQVRILVDALWSGESFLGLSNPQLRQLAKVKNISVHGIEPATLGDDISTTRFKQRDHRKILLVDGTTAIVTGRNCGDEYYYDWRETPISDWTSSDDIPWFDAHIEARGPIVAEIQQSFHAQWQATTGQVCSRPRRSKPAGDIAARLVIHHGVDDANALASYQAFIQGAKSHIYIVNDFPVVDHIADALVQAVHRGIKVKLLTGCVLARRMDGTFFPGERHREAFEYVIKSRFEDLIRAGIDVYEFTTAAMENIVATGDRVKPYVHAKIATVDGLAVNIGSANLDVSASFWEKEANVIVQDSALARRTERRLQKLISRSWQIDLQSAQWKRDAAPRKVIAGLWPDLHLS